MSTLGSGYYPGSGPSFWVGSTAFGFTIKSSQFYWSWIWDMNLTSGWNRNPNLNQAAIPFLNSSRFSNYISTRPNFFFFQKGSEIEDFIIKKKLSCELHPRFLANQKIKIWTLGVMAHCNCPFWDPGTSKEFLGSNQYEGGH